VNEKDHDTGKRDQAAFVAKAKIIFPKGCSMFASFEQLDQGVTKLLLDVWAISRVHGQSKIHCAHGLSHGKSHKLHSTVSMRRKCSPTEKEKLCKCPFEIRYSPQGKPKKTTPDTKPVVFILVKITECVYEHNCSMDTASHWLAFQSNGQATPNLTHHL
jgi:hypothetical protein